MQALVEQIQQEARNLGRGVLNGAHRLTRYRLSRSGRISTLAPGAGWL
jgi:hypothetical protein